MLLINDEKYLARCDGCTEEAIIVCEDEFGQAWCEKCFFEVNSELKKVRAVRTAEKKFKRKNYSNKQLKELVRGMLWRASLLPDGTDEDKGFVSGYLAAIEEIKEYLKR